MNRLFRPTRRSTRGIPGALDRPQRQGDRDQYRDLYVEPESRERRDRPRHPVLHGSADRGEPDQGRPGDSRVRGGEHGAPDPRSGADPVDPGRQGALIKNVVPGGPADQAGLHAGDVIVQLDGKDVTDLTISSG